jgi:hypothetical protein
VKRSSSLYVSCRLSGGGSGGVNEPSISSKTTYAIQRAMGFRHHGHSRYLRVVVLSTTPGDDLEMASEPHLRRHESRRSGTCSGLANRYGFGGGGVFHLALPSKPLPISRRRTSSHLLGGNWTCNQRVLKLSAVKCPRSLLPPTPPPGKLVAHGKKHQVDCSKHCGRGHSLGNRGRIVAHCQQKLLWGLQQLGRHHLHYRNPNADRIMLGALSRRLAILERQLLDNASRSVLVLTNVLLFHCEEWCLTVESRVGCAVT